MIPTAPHRSAGKTDEIQSCSGHMRSLNSVGLGLCVVFGCLALALLAEIYYWLWWKRRWSNSGVVIEHDYSNPATEVLHKLCGPGESCSSSLRSTAHQQHQLSKPSGLNGSTGGDAVEMVMAAGPPRFLFTIKEETKEDMESEDGASKLGDDDHQGRRMESEDGASKLGDDYHQGRRMESEDGTSKLGDDYHHGRHMESEDGTSKLGDDYHQGRHGTRTLTDHQILVKSADSPPYLTPLSSPQFFTPPLTPMRMGSSHCSPSRGYNPFIESSTDAEIKRIRTSPPPFFKFLRDAEEKHERRKREEAQNLQQPLQQEGRIRAPCNGGASMQCKDGAENGSLITILVA